MLFAAGVVPVYAQTLAAPVVSPAGGAFVGPQTVTVIAPPEATVHYTLDGSDPAATSPIYTAPLSITSTTTLRVRAFRLRERTYGDSTHHPAELYSRVAGR